MEKLSVVDPKYPIDYSEKAVPPTYVCGECRATGVKLWRRYQTFSNKLSLRCMNCACKEEGEVFTPTEDGRSLYTGEVCHWWRSETMNLDEGRRYDPKNGPPPDAIRVWTEHTRTRQIGWYVPAVPDERNDSYWGYPFIPQAGYDWWCRLPSYATSA